MARIVIVGAGIAGLNAALTLQDAGLACAIYEASGRIGGRIHSDTTTWADGMVSEWCGEFVGDDHTTIHTLIQRFGLSAIDLGLSSPGLAQNISFFAKQYYSAAAQAQDIQQIIPILQRQAQAAGYPTTHDHFTTEGFRLDHLSVFEWIERHVPGGHTAPIGRLFDMACTGLNGLDSTEQSSLNLIYLFGSLSTAPETPPIRPLQGNSKIVGGNARLPQVVAQSLPQNSIHVRHELRTLERQTDGTLTLTFATPNGTLVVACDHAILALPFSTLRHVDCRHAGFDALKQAAIAELGYGTISKLFLQFDMPYWYGNGPWPHPNTGFIITDMDIQTLWDASLGQTGTHGLLVDYTSGRRGAAFTPNTPYSTTDESADVQRYAHACLQQLEQVLPGISSHYTGKASLSYPTGDPHLLGSYACWRVGQYTQFGGYERVRQGTVHFAGEHCSVEFQGFMEGAAREGARAAREIIQDESAAT